MTVMTESRQEAWRRFTDNEDVRRGAYIVPLALLFMLATVSGPSGNQIDPLSLVRQAISPGRLLTGLVIGIALTAALAGARRLLATGAGTGVGSSVTSARAALTDRRVTWVVTGIAVLLLLVAPPQFTPAYQTVLVNNMTVYALLALGLNVVVGYAGLLDLGYIAFFAIGAYSAAYWSGQLPVQPPVELNLFLVLPIATVTAMVAGVILGAPTLRLRGDYLAIVTLGFGEIVRITLVNADEVTNGPPGVIGIPRFSAFGYNWTSDAMPYYYLGLAIMALVFFAFHRLNESRIGRAWAAIREDEVAAAASGVATVKYKLMAFGIGASTAGLAGVFSASKVGFVSPANFPLLFSILVIVYVIFGGMGSLHGVVIGAAFLEFLPHYLRDKVASDDRFIYFGLLLVLMMVFRPQGLFPSRRRSRELHMEGSHDATGGAGAGAATPVTPT